MRILILTFTLTLLWACNSKENRRGDDRAKDATSTFLSEADGVGDKLISNENNEKIGIELSENQQNLIPENFVPCELISGDLNKDRQEDCILIVKGTRKDNFEENHEGKMVDRNRRGIIIAFRDGENYKKVVENLSCFSSENEDGGAYFPPELTVGTNSNNCLTVDYAHGRYGAWGYIFRYQNNNFELIGFHSLASNGPVEMGKENINFSTKKKQILINTKPDCESGEEVWEETWEDIEIDQLISLDSIINFDELSL